MSELERASLLVELGCEELPPKALARLAESFYKDTCAGLDDSGLHYDADQSRFFFTPRRMSLLLANVELRQPDRTLERKGPAVGAAFDEDGQPTPAARGFAGSVGVDVEALERLVTDKGEWLYCKVEVPGKALSELIFGILEKALEQLPVPKPMRWSDHDFSFVRPVHWLVVLHGTNVLSGHLYGCEADRLTQGHRIHAPGTHELDSSDDYVEKMRELYVLVDQEERQEEIAKGATDNGHSNGGQTRITPELLEEVTNLVEWPVAVVCQFDEAFLSVPQEALIASMESHQKFFPILSSDTGALTPSFVVIANIESRDEPAMREGFERVIRPRLADAQFFWEQDLNQEQTARNAQLERVVFQKDLGSIADKCRRVKGVSKVLAEIIGAHGATAERAAALCKGDLVSQMVGEFPELQGTMGAYYARHANEADEVANAIEEHYRPRFAGDAIPASSAGQLVALADRADTLVGIFAAGLKPTGNKDPFALRRATLGIIRILEEADLAITLDEVIDAAAASLASTISIDEATLVTVRSFILERLRNHLMDSGATTRQVNAVLAAPLGNLGDLVARLTAVNAFMQREEAASLVAANKRIGNILKKQENGFSNQIDANAFVLSEEVELYKQVAALQSSVESYCSEGQYEQALVALGALREPVDHYFDKVMVMDDDPAIRNNRLAQLTLLKSLFDRVADFSQAA